jgi:hypothetical protein
VCSLFFLSSFIWVIKNVRTWGKDREAVHGSQEPGMLR